LKAWAVETMRFRDKERYKKTVLMAPKYLLDSTSDFESRNITDSRKFWSKRLFTPKLGGGVCVDTVFLEKQVKNGLGEAANEKRV
jgi:hypothetical protein